jgi:hypothetical protein
MARIYIGLGSNVERERHLLAGIADLQHTFTAVRLSTVYESAAVGFAGANFFNLVAEAQTEMSLEQVLVALRSIEFAQWIQKKMAVVGHEIGHVVHTDSKDAMKNAYLRSAVKNAAGAANDKVAKLTDSELGAMAEALAGAQFSQKQENEADDYGVEFCVKNGIDPYAMANALSKLAELAKDAPKASYAQRMFSSHPDTQKRIERTKAKADSYAKK